MLLPLCCQLKKGGVQRMTKDEKRLMRKVYSLLQILKDETDKYYIKDEIDTLSEQLERALDD